jgi:hypothetical protein
MKYLKWIWLIIRAALKRSKLKVVSFTKESDQKWYVDFPNWPLAHYHLMMVAGSDKFLDYLNDTTNHVRLKVNISNDNKTIPNTIKLVKVESTLTGGAYYKVETPLSGWNPEKELWLCPVTLAVLGQYPEYIYIKKI